MFFIVTHSPLFYKGLLLVYSSDKSYLKALNQKKKSHFVRNRNRPSILSHSCLVFKFFSTCFHSTILLHHERKATQSFLTQKKTLWASWVGRQKGFAEFFFLKGCYLSILLINPTWKPWTRKKNLTLFATEIAPPFFHTPVKFLNFFQPVFIMNERLLRAS